MENLFEYYIGTDKLHYKYAKGEPSAKGQEFHDYNEFVFFIKGQSFFVSKNIQQELTSGSLILIPKEHFHQFRIEQPETYVRCILGFRDNPETDSLIREIMNTVKVLSAPDKRVVLIFEQLNEIIKSELSEEEKVLFINSSLVQLLIYMKQNAFKLVNKCIGLSPIVSRALKIIDEKYTENLSVKTIAEMLYVSPSALAHKFSKELNISVYRYITKKRLSAVRESVSRGESLTEAAINNGFSDYSCFYRLYKKYNKE